ncbi:hypothetical protein E2L09_08030 [Enterococcus hirae]|uniref:hypothetical protein n=1 Tax=Enterococcus hirae TaxID=1354 RepID=UPI00136217AB|nr:hypothetical protein [Enterococcus hirae]EMF0170198.1 hypothetical protein [Enterococcus hirae]EMF0424448.1 hypothetical protein [Enterococcus hirae]NBJ42955.1 hypothetical protein [Enterococcus hirae]QIV90287.1 hypothetical protein E2L09_08030 [Enterococcus hirae]
MKTGLRKTKEENKVANKENCSPLKESTILRTMADAVHNKLLHFTNQLVVLKSNSLKLLKANINTEVMIKINKKIISDVIRFMMKSFHEKAKISFTTEFLVLKASK